MKRIIALALSFSMMFGVYAYAQEILYRLNEQTQTMERVVVLPDDENGYKIVPFSDGGGVLASGNEEENQAGEQLRQEEEKPKDENFLSNKIGLAAGILVLALIVYVTFEVQKKKKSQ